MNTIFCKIHSRGKDSILAVCDKELLGKTLKQGELEFKVSTSFYSGKETTEQELREMLKEHTNINLVGEKSIGVAIKENLISEKNIIRISGVPHAQIFKV